MGGLRVGIRDLISEMAERLEWEVVLLDGLDDAIAGVSDTPDGFVVVYDLEKCIEILTRDNGGDREAALEWFDFNIRSTEVEGWPIFLERLTVEER